MLNGRWRFGSGRRPVATPKFALLLGPISLLCAMPSPLVGRTWVEQVEVPGIKLQSNQLRRSLTWSKGLERVARSVARHSMYLLAENLSAVFASPWRSYTAPKRETTFDHTGR